MEWEGEVKMVGDWKVLFVAYRAQILHETVPESTIGLTDVEEASGAFSPMALTLRDGFVENLCSLRDKRQHLPVNNHFNSPSHSVGDMSILGLLQCHNDTTCKLE
eukprot:g43131.t1